MILKYQSLGLINPNVPTISTRPALTYFVQPVWEQGSPHNSKVQTHVFELHVRERYIINTILGYTSVVYLVQTHLRTPCSGENKS